MELYEFLYKIYTGELEVTCTNKATALSRSIVAKHGKLTHQDETQRAFHAQPTNDTLRAYNDEWNEVPRKEMTLEDIEKELGYPISIQLENKAQKNDEIINSKAIYNKSNKVYPVPMLHDYVNIWQR